MDTTMSAFDFIDSLNADTVQLTSADESAIFLTALQDACTPEEWQLVMENMTELELYGLIDSASVATEAKRIVYRQTKQMNLSREESKAAIRLAKRAKSPMYKKYAAAKKKYLHWKNEIHKTFGPRARKEARDIVSGARKKASSMSDNAVTGRTIAAKMDKKISEMSSKK